MCQSTLLEQPVDNLSPTDVLVVGVVMDVLFMWSISAPNRVHLSKKKQKRKEKKKKKKKSVCGHVEKIVLTDDLIVLFPQCFRVVSSSVSKPLIETYLRSGHYF